MVLKMVVKKVLKTIGRIGLCVFTFVLMAVITILTSFYLFCHGPSESAKELFVTTFLETGNMKFVVSLFLNENEVKKVVESNSLKSMSADVDKNLVNVDTTDNSIVIEEVSGNTYSGTMMIIKDASRVFLGTTYPWSEYGFELDKIVNKYNAIAGINGGLYVSTANKGGRPIGIVVSQGEIQNNNGIGYAGMHLIGFDESNILRIISLDGKSSSDLENLVKTEKIRDAVAFQEEATDSNNHFVKLIVNGEKRELNGLGSGANPRTVIGQRKDGTVLFFVTDGRGANGHLGATAADLIEVMEKYGAINAANLDGGSSSTMYYNGSYLRTSVTLYYSNSSWKIPTAFLVKGESWEKNNLGNFI